MDYPRGSRRRFAPASRCLRMYLSREQDSDQ